jgi:hypothetical protein
VTAHGTVAAAAAAAAGNLSSVLHAVQNADCWLRQLADKGAQPESTCLQTEKSYTMVYIRDTFECIRLSWNLDKGVQRSHVTTSLSSSFTRYNFLGVFQNCFMQQVFL